MSREEPRLLGNHPFEQVPPIRVKVTTGKPEYLDMIKAASKRFGDRCGSDLIVHRNT